MTKILFNDLFHLSKDEIAISKIALNMQSDNRLCFYDWYESDLNNRYVDFSYWSHYGKGKNFQEGELCFGFVRLPHDPDKWLFRTIEA